MEGSPPYPQLGVLAYTRATANYAFPGDYYQSVTTTDAFLWNVQGLLFPLDPTSAPGDPWIIATRPVPEPSSAALMGLGGIGLAFGAYRRRRAAAV